MMYYGQHNNFPERLAWTSRLLVNGLTVRKLQLGMMDLQYENLRASGCTQMIESISGYGIQFLIIRARLSFVI